MDARVPCNLVPSGHAKRANSPVAEIFGNQWGVALVIVFCFEYRRQRRLLSGRMSRFWGGGKSVSR